MGLAMGFALGLGLECAENEDGIEAGGVESHVRDIVDVLPDSYLRVQCGTEMSWVWPSN